MAELFNPTPSLQELAEEAILRQIGTAVDGPNPIANYCCGGQIESSFTIRWDDPLDNEKPNKITLPFEGKEDTDQLDKLAQACMDNLPSKMLSTRYYSTNFDPYSVGIIGFISKSILPGYLKRDAAKRILPVSSRRQLAEADPKGHSAPRQPGLRAELAGLSVRTVDANPTNFPSMPNRHVRRLGTLILSLPCSYKGGALNVHNGDHSTSFDSSKHSRHKFRVQWAAFFTECDYNISPITEGYQILLVYDLYLEKSMGRTILLHPDVQDDSSANALQLVRPPQVDVSVYPIYESLRKLLENPVFLKNGRTLGFHCRHEYHHVDGTKVRSIDVGDLRGLDLIMASMFKSFGLSVKIAPLLGFAELFENEEYEYDREWIDYHDDPDYYTVAEFLYFDEADPKFPTFDKWQASRPANDFIGKKFHPLTHSTLREDLQRPGRRLYMERAATQDWPHAQYTDIHWLNKRQESRTRPWEVAIITLQEIYDSDDDLNEDVEPTVEQYYSLPVLLVKIPPYEHRSVEKAKDAMLKGLNE